MRTTATSRYRRAACLQRIPVTLVKWTSLLLILLAITVNTSGGELPIARANPSTTAMLSRFLHDSDLCPAVGSGYTIPMPSAQGICVYTLNSDSETCRDPYRPNGRVCSTFALGTDQSYCLSNPGAALCQPGQACANLSTAPGCTINDYCTVHAEDATCTSSSVAFFCLINPGAKHCQPGQEC